MSSEFMGLHRYHPSCTSTTTRHSGYAIIGRSNKEVYLDRLAFPVTRNGLSRSASNSCSLFLAVSGLLEGYGRILWRHDI